MMSKRQKVRQKEYRNTPEGKRRHCADSLRYYAGNLPEELERRHRHNQEVKLEVLTHYGPSGVLGCCWENCSVIDLDMLTLDHIKDDGARHVLPGRKHRLTGTPLYRWARKHKYPKTLQTLCANHQFKKKMLKYREDKLGRLGLPKEIK